MAYIFIAPEDLSEEELVVRCLSEPEAFGLIIERYEHKLINYVCCRFIQDPEQAKDIVQESFIKAYFSLSSFDPQRKWRPWLYKIVTNTAYSFLRLPMTESIEKYRDVFTSGECLENKLDTVLKAEQINRALGLLTAESRQVVVLSYKGLTFEEIGVRLALPLAIVKARFNRARMELLSVMENL